MLHCRHADAACCRQRHAAALFFRSMLLLFFATLIDIAADVSMLPLTPDYYRALPILRRCCS